ncbi:MAG: isoprenoid biosynthesis glyoxalase ElbB [Deltaproteobacteria bacterium]|nr:isoprenoid biosynthesis glyoxalase ElbB [Deltaproteobacteria bacterium]
MTSGKKQIGVILSGAGFLDGSEIHEAVLALLAIDEAGAEARVFAPDGKLAEVDHKTGKPTGKERGVLEEAARIARSNIADLASVGGADVDGWVLPGGYGAAKTLSDFASKGAGATVHKEVGRVLREALAAQVPVGACCIAPAVVAAAARQANAKLRLTIGNDPDTAKQIAAMGHAHVVCPVDDVVVDTDRKVVTAPAYMYDAPIAAVARGIKKMVQQVVAWA